MFLITELHHSIAQFLEFKDLLHLRHLCRHTFHNYTPAFICSRLYSFIIPMQIIVKDVTNITILTNFKNLQKLICSEWNIIKDKHLALLTNLTYLNLWHQIEITNYPFTKLNNLQVLYLANSPNVTERGLKCLANTLTHLVLHFMNTFQIVPMVYSLPKLKLLAVEGNIVEINMPSLKYIIKLRTVDIKNTTIALDNLYKHNLSPGRYYMCYNTMPQVHKLINDKNNEVIGCIMINVYN